MKLDPLQKPEPEESLSALIHAVVVAPPVDYPRAVDEAVTVVEKRPSTDSDL